MIRAPKEKGERLTEKIRMGGCPNKRSPLKMPFNATPSTTLTLPLNEEKKRVASN